MTTKDYQKPAFDPNREFESVEDKKPAFNPNAEYEAADEVKKKEASKLALAGLQKLASFFGVKTPASGTPSTSKTDKETITEYIASTKQKPSNDRIESGLTAVTKPAKKNLPTLPPKKEIEAEAVRRLTSPLTSFQNQQSQSGLSSVGDDDDPIGSMVEKLQRDREFTVSSTDDIFDTDINTELAINSKQAELIKEYAIENSRHGKQVLQQILSKKEGVQLPDLDNIPVEEIEKLLPNTLTANIAFEKYLKRRLIDDEFDKGTPIEEMAARLYEGQTIQDIPEAKAGELVDIFLNDPEVIEKSNESQELKGQYQEAKFNLYKKYPSYGLKKVTQLISQEREDRGMNSWFLNTPSVKTTDKLVDDMFNEGKLNFDDVDFYQKAVRPVIEAGFGESVIKTPDLLHSFGEGLEEAGEGIASSARDLFNKVTLSRFQKVGLMESDEDRLNRLIQKEYSTPVVIPKHASTKAASGAGHFTGFAAPMILGAYARIPQLATNIMMFEGANADRALMLFPKNKAKQNLYTLLGTTVDVTLGHLLPTEKAARGFSKIFQKDISSIVNKLSSKEISEAVAKQTVLNKIKDYAISLGVNNFKTANVLTAFTLAHNGLDAAFGQRDFKLEDQAREAVDNYKTNWLSGTFVSALAAKASTAKLNGNMLREMALEPEKYRQLLQSELKSKPELAESINEKLSNLDHLVEVNKLLEGKEKMDDRQKAAFLALSLREKILTEKTKEIPDKSLKTDGEKELATIEIEKEKILNPDMSNTELVKEFYENELLGKGSIDMLSNENGKFDETKVGAYLKEVAQRANNLDAEGNVNTFGDTRNAAAEAYPSQIIEIANERWPEYKRKGDEQGELLKPISEEKTSVSVIMPEENKITGEAITIDKPEYIPEPKTKGAAIILPKQNEESAIESVPDVTIDEVNAKAKTGEPISFTAYRKEASDSHDLKRGVYFGDNMIVSEYVKKGDQPGAPKSSMNKYQISFNNPLVIPDKEVFIRELALNGDKEAQEAMPNYKENQILSPKYDKAYDFDLFVAKKARELGYDGIISELEYIVLDNKSYKKISNAQNQQTTTNSNQQAKASDSVTVPEQLVQGAAEGQEPPISEPPKTAGVYVERPNTELSHKGLQDVANEFSLPDVQTRDRKSDVQLRQDARETVDKWLDKGTYSKNVESLVRKAEKGEILTDKDRVILEGHLANVSQQLREITDKSSPEFDAKLAEVKRLKDAGEKTRSEAGAALRIPMGGSRPKDLADFLVEEMNAAGVDKLTEKQKQTAAKEYEEITEAEKKYDEKIAGLEAENSKKLAEKEVKKIPAKKTKKTHDDFVKERQDIFAAMREKLRAARGDTTATILPYAKELIAIAPEVGKLVKNLVEEGVTKLSDIVREIHSTLKEDIKEIKEQDVIDLIAGKYTEKKPTRNDLAEKLRDLKYEAKLLSEIDRLEKNEPKSEKKKVARNKNLKGLQDKLKELKKKRGEGELTDEQRLASAKSRIKKQIEEIEEQLRTGDFSKPEKKEPVQLDEEGLKLQDNLIELRKQRAIRLMKQEYEKSSSWEKATEVAANVLGVPRSLMATLDYSAPLRQSFVATVSNPKLASHAAIEMFKASFSQKHYDRWFDNLYKSERYKLMGDSGLAITDSNNPKLSAREEAYMASLAQKIPVVGKLVKGSERAYVIYLNKMRADIFNRFVDEMQKNGKTFQNSPEQYKQMAAYVNNITGRGDLGKTLNDSAPLLNALFFSQRLMASRINTLTYLMQPRFYTKVPAEVRKSYFKDILTTSALGMTILGLAKMAGADTEDDPRSPDFGKIKYGDTRWDIWGGHQQYIKTVAQMISGKRKSSTSGNITDMKAKERFMGTGLSFLRGKLSPVPSALVDIAMGENIVGEKLTTNWESGYKEVGIGENLANHLLPLIITGTMESMKDQGPKALFTVGVPAVFGVGTQTYSAPVGAFTDEEKKDPVFKYFLDLGADLPGTNTESIEIEQKDGKTLKKLSDYEKEDIEKFTQARKKYLKEELQSLKDGDITVYVDSFGRVSTSNIDKSRDKEEISLDKLTKDQWKELMSTLGGKATKRAKTELFAEE